MQTSEIISEGRAKLEAYLKTGIDGFRQQGIDRLKAGGIRVEQDMEHEVEHLVEHLRTWNY